MGLKKSYEKLEEKIRLLEHEAEQRQRFEKINSALFTIANAVNTTSNLNELFGSIHEALGPIIDTTNFYIALYDREGDSIHFPYFVDSVDEKYPPVVSVSETASLTGEVIRRNAPLLIEKSEILRLREESPYNAPDCSLSETWLGVPLQIHGQIVGVMAVQSYVNPACYDQTDIEVMVAVSAQAALAIDRKQKEEALLESEARFRRIVETANEGIVSVDADWRIVYVNEHFTKMLGYEYDGLIGRPLQDFFRKEDLEDFAHQQEVRRQGEPRTFERAFKTQQGDLVHTLVSATSILDENEVFQGSFGMITDITAQKNAEEKLQDTVKQLRQALEQIKTLRGIVPICMKCKKIRDDQGFWKQVEVYVREHTEAEFSHGLCPDCIGVFYPDMTNNLEQ